MAPARARSAATLLQGLGQLGLGTGQTRDQTEYNPRSNRNNRHHDQDGEIYVYFAKARHCARAGTFQKFNSPNRQQYACDPATDCQQNTLDQQLPQQSPPAGAECDSDRELAFARACPSEQHGREVCTGNEQDKCYSTEQDRQPGPHSADHLVLQRINFRAKAIGSRVIIGILLPPVINYVVELCLGLSLCYTVAKPANNAVTSTPALFQFAFAESDRLPYIDTL